MLRLFEPRDAAHFIFEPGKDYGPAAQRLRPLWETPLPTVRSARVGWCRLHPCRLTIEFTDGSWTAFASLFEMPRRKARTAVRALSWPLVSRAGHHQRTGQSPRPVPLE
ncbi:hypothetical protein GCM10010532_026220 [Dactylosporangium siamense]|uniref:Uncharacterized protein n=1 Tax=Dactylosporangium siamense TaxID=685454 RepID=A0A919PFR3_9ACTN|nr:hypothetical protein Dsi01nite_005980 [Dactylosporangium siamense]